MALLNKLFFPSASAPTPTTTNLQAAAAPSAASQTTSTAAPPITTSKLIKSQAAATTVGAAEAASRTQASANSSTPVKTTQTSRNYLSQFPFDGRQVRVLLYKEDDSRGRRLLFDSNALQKVTLKEATSSSTGKFLKNARSGEDKYSALQNGKMQSKAHSNTNNFIDVCPEYGYRHNRPSSTDITPMGEMVFGSLAMSFCGTALKVHWLPEPARILCSQVFLTPMSSSAGCASSGHSPYSTISMNSLATPRTSICSEQGSIDGLSMNSFSMPFSVSVCRQMSLTSPLDVPGPDQQSLSINSADSGPRFSSTYSNATDSGYSGLSSSRSGSGGGTSGPYSSDQWSYQYSTRSSLGSVLSDQSDPVRKLSMDSALFPSSPHLEEFANDGCLVRRISRNLRTSFEYENSQNDFIGFLSDNYDLNPTTGGSEGGGMGAPQYRRASYCTTETRSNPEMGKRQASIKKRAKLGLAVCIIMSESFEEEMELFCSEHIALLESMLSRLRASTELAYLNHKNFLQVMFQAWQDAQKWFNDLFTAPRIKTPVWLSITTSGSKYSKMVAERFIKELCDLLSFADTKDSNFFISTMLTGILTYHLGWVATVSAFNTSTSRRSEASTAAIEQRAKLLQVSQKHPYNALWAQLGDLYGAIGIHPKLARTVIYGTEKLWVEKLLNVLTYFIRCGEVRRAAKREDFNKELINQLVSQNNNEKLKKSSMSPHPSRAPGVLRRQPASGGIGSGIVGSIGGGGGGLTRTSTCKQNLNAIVDDDELGSEEDEPDNSELIGTLKKNEIPTVLAFRDSHFVQQELRIGNYHMDTGIDKTTLLAKQAQRYFRTDKDGRIKLTVTTPDNVEMTMEEDSNASVGTGSIDDGAIEALDYDSADGSSKVVTNTDTSNNNSEKQLQGKKNFLWNIVPTSEVKEGLSLSDIEKLQQGVNIINRKLERRNSNPNVTQQGEMETYTQERRASHLSLSDLITQNSIGKSDRMTWGIEPIKENVSLEEQIHFDLCQKQIEREHGICRTTTDNGNGVVFVLGDNEPLINIKKSTEDLADGADDAKPAMLCALHQRSHDATIAKKHSGMKFNFEQYPQIATNYMKSKNLVISNYDLLMDKATKLDATEALKTSDSNVTLHQPADLTASSSSAAAISGSTTSVSSDRCVMCNSGLSVATYQTPSNATELEFETDEVHCFGQSSNSLGRKLQPASSATSIDTLKSAPNDGEQVTAPGTAASPSQPPSNEVGCNDISTVSYTRKLPKRVPSQRSSISSVAAKCAAVNESQQLLKLPVPGIKELPQEDEPPGDKLRAGFIPSLLLSVNDHYVSDMVLQGTCAPPAKWKMHLREDLALAARSASLISQPAENIAIVADMDKWDVSLISSQAQQFAGDQSSPVGMSQLVSSMLETVQAMHVGGIPAYECLSFLESKLQEIYLQSETLAALLLETDLCRLSDITTPLQLSENDVPLLLSIAYIHTPKIGRKYGISFR